VPGYDVVVPARDEESTVGAVVRAALAGCLRTVPLWTYGAYLRHSTVLPPHDGGSPCRPHPEARPSAPQGDA
jgi:hypothetical protein